MAHKVLPGASREDTERFVDGATFREKSGADERQVPCWPIWRVMVWQVKTLAGLYRDYGQFHDGGQARWTHALSSAATMRNMAINVKLGSFPLPGLPWLNGILFCPNRALSCQNLVSSRAWLPADVCKLERPGLMTLVYGRLQKCMLCTMLGYFGAAILVFAIVMAIAFGQFSCSSCL